MHGPAEYRVQAHNLSHASENRIHDDAIARRFGFDGALVPGVEVYAYMTHLPAARWGREWLERGTAECRFLRPVYDGRLVTVTASPADGGLAIIVESAGTRCAAGAAALPDDPGPPCPVSVAAPTPAPDERPDADEATLAPGRHLSSHPQQFTRGKLEQYLADIRETEPLYAREGLVHPALMLRLSNAALRDNVRLGPWIHAASTIRHCALAHAGVCLAAHAEVAANYERSGHRWVELDVVVATDRGQAIAQVRHTAIYRLRPSG